MKRLFLTTLFLALTFILPLPTMAQVSVNIGISLPPRIWFEAPPRMVVLPETDIYVTPDVSADIFFFEGWWWRPWHGRWYRSHHYNSDWQYYDRVPSFYRHVPRDWKKDYVEHHWRGYRWNAQPIPYHNLQKNWREWRNERYWERHHSWGVQGLRRQSEQRYRQEVIPHYRREDNRKYDHYDKYDKHDNRGHHGNH